MTQKEQAKAEASKIITEAQAAIDTLKNGCAYSKNQVGKLVIEVSEKVLERELASKESQERYVKDLVGRSKIKLIWKYWRFENGSVAEAHDQIFKLIHFQIP